MYWDKINNIERKEAIDFSVALFLFSLHNLEVPRNSLILQMEVLWYLKIIPTERLHRCRTINQYYLKNGFSMQYFT